MNWFTKKIMADNDTAAKQKVVNEWGGCEHVEADPSKLFVVHYENDSFGREGYGVCEACDRKRTEDEGSQFYTCVDCKTSKPLKEMLVWTWYDFFAAQGDEPYHLCRPCFTADKHQNRMRKDREDRDWELGLRDEDDGE